VQKPEDGLKKIRDLHQIDQDRMLLMAEDNSLKLIDRNPDTLKMELTSIYSKDGVLYDLFAPEEWARVTQFCSESEIALPDLTPAKGQGILIAQLQELFKYLFVSIDSIPSCKQNANYLETVFLLSTKLAILRVHSPDFIPNPILLSSIDWSSLQYSSQFFPQAQGAPFRTIPSQAVTNTSSWHEISGSNVSIVGVTQNYVCAVVNKAGESDSFVEILHLGNWGIKQVFSEKITGDGL
jgi:hypothetical protein